MTTQPNKQGIGQYRTRFAGGTVIFAEGSPGDCAYIIESGRVEISTLRAGRSQVLAQLAAGDLFGEMALIDNELRSARAFALEPTEVVVLRREQLQAKLTDTDPLIDLLLRVVLERFRNARGQSPGRPAAPADGRSWADQRDAALKELHLEEDLATGLAEGQFALRYQPIVDINEGRISGFEALMRWQHPERGLVSPEDFIGVAEYTGQIIALGRWAMEEACRAHKSFQTVLDRHGRGRRLFMTINLSARQLAAPDILANLETILGGIDVPPGDIKLEITESLLLEDPEQAAVVLHKIRELGMGLAIDDFGTGYSSLSYLHRFPIDTLKIDRSFVTALDQDTQGARIIRAISDLARSLEMYVVAEGVETEHQLAELQRLGCTFGQGYLLSRPLDSETVIRKLAADPRMI
ncbi:MAG: EAL domain-containing protein [Gammaproteobacteria bacterium]|nr:EAL domain-containing protein [Gammaproteobacteria bacterium]